MKNTLKEIKQKEIQIKNTINLREEKVNRKVL